MDEFEIYQVDNISPLKYVSLEKSENFNLIYDIQPQSSASSMCIVAKRNVSSFEPLWCPLCQLSVSTQPATVEPLLYCLSLQSSDSYSGSVEGIESTESLPYGLQAFLFQYFGFHRLPFTAEITSYMQFAHLNLFVHLHSVHKSFVHPHCVHNTNNNVSSSVAVS